MYSQEELLKKIENDPDFIALKRFDYSLSKFQDRYPNGAPDRIIAQALSMSESEFKELYIQTISKLRSVLKIEE